MKRRHLLTALGAGLLPAAGRSFAATEPLPPRPKVAGAFRLHGRRRGKVAGLTWRASETALIICDMWDDHWCKLAADRVATMAPRLNEAVSAARAHGAAVIHAPSDTMPFYEGTTFRRRMQQAPLAQPPVKIEHWCTLDAKREGALPIDDADGGCDDPAPSGAVKPYPWKRQHHAIGIVGFDGVTDSGVELYNFCRAEGIRNLAVMGVHTNMCVLGRSFGIRQMVRVGMNVVLVRDLTDALYDPRDRPFVSHARGTALVVEHIERHWCPSVLAVDLTRVV